MKIDVYDGCTMGVNIDETPYQELSIYKQKQILKKLIDTIDSQYYQDVLSNIISWVGDYKDYGYCEQCGSYNHSYIYNL